MMRRCVENSCSLAKAIALAKAGAPAHDRNRHTKTTPRKQRFSFAAKHLQTLANTQRFMELCYGCLTPIWARVPFVGWIMINIQSSTS